MSENQTAPGARETTVFSSEQQFVEGIPVFDARGEKIGHVANQRVQGDALVVEKGWFFPEDFYIPLNAVARNVADGVYLNLNKEDVLNQPRYTEAGRAASGAGARAINTEPTVATRPVEIARGNVRVPVREEELIVDKQQREMGHVYLHKGIVEEQRTVAEPVTRDEVRLERVALQGEAVEPGPDTFVEQDFDITVMGEELVVGKRVVVTEEIRLYKESITEEQRVTETLRKERVTVEGVDETISSERATPGGMDETTVKCGGVSYQEQTP